MRSSKNKKPKQCETERRKQNHHKQRTALILDSFLPGSLLLSYSLRFSFFSSSCVASQLSFTSLNDLALSYCSVPVFFLFLSVSDLLFLVLLFCHLCAYCFSLFLSQVLFRHLRAQRKESGASLMVLHPLRSSVILHGVVASPSTGIIYLCDYAQSSHSEN